MAHQAQCNNSIKCKKDDLLRLVAAKKPTTTKYRIDELAKKHGHKNLRLPSYHPDLNPIELIWSQIKSYVTRNNKDFNITGVQKLFEESLEHITEERLMKAIRHVDDIEKSFWEKGNIRNIEINDILLNIPTVPTATPDLMKTFRGKLSFQSYNFHV